jgi:glutathione S-transferase
MYELIIANKNYSSWSMRSWVLMRHLGIPFTERLLRFAPGVIKQHSPSGRVPCLVDGQVKVWDTLAIAEYLAERHAGVWPAEATARAWARSAAAEMHSGFAALRNECSMSVGVRLSRHVTSDALQADLARLAELWADGFARHGGPYLGGEQFTAVDAFFAPVATRVVTYGLALPTPAATYVGRLMVVPAVRQWVADGIAEDFRDPAHEDEILAQGTLLADLRAPVSVT